MPLNGANPAQGFSFNPSGAPCQAGLANFHETGIILAAIFVEHTTPCLIAPYATPRLTAILEEIHNVPVTLMVARRVANGRYHDFIAWLREGEHLATDFPGYLGSGVLAPPADDDEFQIVFRFSDEQTMASSSIPLRARRGCSVVRDFSPNRRKSAQSASMPGSVAPTARLRAGSKAWRSGWRSFRCRWLSICCSAPGLPTCRW